MYNEITNAIDAQQHLDGNVSSVHAGHWNNQPASSTQVPVPAIGSTANPPPPTQILVQTAITQSPAAQTPSQPASANPSILPPALATAIAPAPAPAPAHVAAPHHHNHLPDRVFKLQFDARRVICCSQTTVIVGWDFANNDEQIIEASRFFAPIE